MTQDEDNFSIENACFRTIGERLKHIRKVANLSPALAAAAAGISKTELFRLENDLRVIRQDHVHIFAKTYKITSDHLQHILQYKSSSKIAVFSSEKVNYVPLRKNFKCFRQKSGEDVDIKLSTRFEFVGLTLNIPTSDQAYGLYLGSCTANTPFPQSSLAIIDPAARTVLGDLVRNPASSDTPLIKLHRDDDGILIGYPSAAEPIAFSDKTSVGDFEKVIVVLLAPHLFIAKNDNS